MIAFVAGCSYIDGYCLAAANASASSKLHLSAKAAVSREDEERKRTKTSEEMQSRTGEDERRTQKVAELCDKLLEANVVNVVIAEDFAEVWSIGWTRLVDLLLPPADDAAADDVARHWRGSVRKLTLDGYVKQYGDSDFPNVQSLKFGGENLRLRNNMYNEHHDYWQEWRVERVVRLMDLLPNLQHLDVLEWCSSRTFNTKAVAEWVAEHRQLDSLTIRCKSMLEDIELPLELSRSLRSPVPRWLTEEGYADFARLAEKHRGWTFMGSTEDYENREGIAFACGDYGSDTFVVNVYDGEWELEQASFLVSRLAANVSSLHVFAGATTPVVDFPRLLRAVVRHGGGDKLDRITLHAVDAMDADLVSRCADAARQCCDLLVVEPWGDARG